MKHHPKQLRWARDILNNWYGEDRGGREFAAHFGTKPGTLDKAMDKIVGRFVSPREIMLRKIRENWETIVGQQNARILIPGAMSDDNILEVEVSHPAFLVGMNKKTMSELFRNKINEYCGKQMCRGIHFASAGGSYRY